jgi:hypothetical protein
LDASPAPACNDGLANNEITAPIAIAPASRTFKRLETSKFSRPSSYAASKFIVVPHDNLQGLRYQGPSLARLGIPLWARPWLD